MRQEPIGRARPLRDTRAEVSGPDQPARGVTRPESPPDRRSQRSRRLIVQAFYALLRAERYDRITVQQIIDRADVGRSTFYAHFRDKEAVLVGEFERVLAELDAREQADRSPGTGGARAAESAGELLPSLRLFRHVHDHQPLYRALVRGHAIDLIHRAAHQYLRESVERRLGSGPGAGSHSIPAARAESTPPSVPASVLADFLVGAFLTLVWWWLDNGLPYPPEELDAIFQRLTRPGVEAALDHGAAGR